MWDVQTENNTCDPTAIGVGIKWKFNITMYISEVHYLVSVLCGIHLMDDVVPGYKTPSTTKDMSEIFI